jgi:hypothetical protein
VEVHFRFTAVVQKVRVPEGQALCLPPFLFTATNPDPDCLFIDEADEFPKDLRHDCVGDLRRLAKQQL